MSDQNKIANRIFRMVINGAIVILIVLSSALIIDDLMGMNRRAAIEQRLSAALAEMEANNKRASAVLEKLEARQ